MIEWDEVLEDINWGKSIGILVVGLLLIVGTIFTLLDYRSYKRLERLYKHDLETIRNFEHVNKVPGPEKIAAIESDKKQLEAELDARVVRLPTEIETDAIETRLEELARASGVTIDNLRWGVETDDGYCRVSPLQFVLKGSPRPSAAFLTGLYKLSDPLADRSEKMRLDKVKNVKLEFYSFNTDTWSEINSCDKGEAPVIEEHDKTTMIFGGQEFKDLKDEVDRGWATFTTVIKDANDACNLKNSRDRAKAELEVLKNKVQNR